MEKFHQEHFMKQVGKMYLTNKISQKFGKFANTKFPKPIQNLINKAYVNLLGLDMSEFQNPSQYPSLNALFTRELLKDRKFDKSKDNFISPADSFISVAAKLQLHKSLQIKGMKYDINELLTQYIDKKNIQKLYNSEYVNFYLSPKDYHRYHSPYFFKLTKAIYVPGRLIPVNIPALNRYDNLFVKNERVILECQTDNKLFYMVFVGALNVGKMKFFFDDRICTNNNTTKIQIYKYDNLHIAKGECLGYFEMGSTILIFWEKDFISLKPIQDTKVKYGDIVAVVK
jgi:phosphatidylserine decarboxylase